MTARRLFFRLFLTFWIVYALHWAPWIVREHYPAVTLAESGSLNVERFTAWSEDIFPGPRGGAYINNNPGASILAGAVLSACRPLLHATLQLPAAPLDPAGPEESRPYRRAAHEGRLYYFIAVTFLSTALVMAPLSAAAAALLGLRLFTSGLPWTTAALASALYAFATPVFFRTSYLNHNLMVCQLGLIAFLLLWKQKPSTGRLWAAGLLAGYAILCDFTGFILAAFLGLYLFRLERRTVLHYALGVLPGLAALALYQQMAFGAFTRPAQHFMTPTAPTIHGYRGITWPSLDLAWANFFHPNFGLFVFCPLLLAAFAAPWVSGRRYNVPRPLASWIYAYFLAFVVFCAANHYSWLQWTTGFRYLVPAVPGLLLLSLQVLDAMPRVWAGSILTASLLLQWTLALTYEWPLRIPARLLGDGIQFCWLREIRAHGLLTSPWLDTPVWVTAGALLIWLVWRRTAPRPRIGVNARH